MLTENTVNTIWKVYGKYIILAALAIFIGMGIFQFREHQKAARTEQASLLYDKIYETLRRQDVQATKDLGNQLVSKYPETPYAALAALLQARLELEQNNSTQAIEQLRTALTLAKRGPVEHIARVRLARVLADKAEYEQALKLLETDPNGYTALYEEVKGDIYMKQNNLDKAREAYAKAGQAVPMGAPAMTLQLKQNDLNNKENS